MAVSLEYRFESVDISNVQHRSTILNQETGTRTRSGLRADSATTRATACS